MKVDVREMLSVIIPVYNAELWLEQALESVFNQTYQNKEVICINDHSIDHSLEILRKYEKKGMIKVIDHKVNIGPGASRNEGIEIARGEYIHFLDADDYLIDKNFYSIAVEKLTDFDLDLFVFNNFELDDKTGSYLEERQRRARFIYKRNELNHVLNGNEIEARKLFLDPFPWTKIIRKSILLENGVKFPEKIFWEDTAFSQELSLVLKRVWISDRKFLAYRINVDSSTSSNMDKKWKDIVPMHETIYAFMAAKSFLEKYKVKYLIFCYQSLLLFYLSNISVQFKEKLNFEIATFFKAMSIKDEEIKVLAGINGRAAKAIKFYRLAENPVSLKEYFIRALVLLTIQEEFCKKEWKLFGKFSILKSVRNKDSGTTLYFIGRFCLLAVYRNVIKLFDKIPIVQKTEFSV